MRGYPIGIAVSVEFKVLFKKHICSNVADALTFYSCTKTAKLDLHFFSQINAEKPFQHLATCSSMPAGPTGNNLSSNY